MKDWILNAYSNISLDCYWQTHRKDILKKKLSESIFDLVLSILLHEINTNKFLKWTGKPKFRLRNLVKQIAWFICLFAGAYYDLNSKNSACSPCCSIDIV